jgi:hypothetical protein
MPSVEDELMRKRDWKAGVKVFGNVNFWWGSNEEIGGSIHSQNDETEFHLDSPEDNPTMLNR